MHWVTSMYVPKFWVDFFLFLKLQTSEPSEIFSVKSSSICHLKKGYYIHTRGCSQFWSKMLGFKTRGCPWVEIQVKVLGHINVTLVTSFMNVTFGVIIHEFLLALRLNPPLACSLSRLSRPPPLRLLRLDLISPTFPPFLPGPIEVDEAAFDELKLFFPNWLWIRAVVGDHSNFFNFFWDLLC